jgi:hypothetical protein
VLACRAEAVALTAGRTRAVAAAAARTSLRIVNLRSVTESGPPEKYGPQPGADFV